MGPHLVYMLLSMAGMTLAQFKSPCNEEIALNCINSTIARKDRDSQKIANGRLYQTYQDLYCSLVFNLKVSKLECVDEAVHGCGHRIRMQVTDRYQQVMDEYQGKCSRKVPEPNSATGVQSWSTLIILNSLLTLFAFNLS